MGPVGSADLRDNAAVTWNRLHFSLVYAVERPLPCSLLVRAAIACVGHDDCCRTSLQRAGSPKINPIEIIWLFLLAQFLHQ
jgi:hypothetical protein